MNIIKNQINDIITKIANEYQPEKIILFGSHAEGNYKEDSDLDFILIKKSTLPRYKRGVEVRRLFYGLAIPMDFKIYTPQEFIEELKNKYSFLNSALKNSRVVYERKD